MSTDYDEATIRDAEQAIAEEAQRAQAEQELEHFTDQGNARRLVRDHGADLRYCDARKSWLVWDGKRWAPDGTGAAMRMAKDTVREIYAEAGRVLITAATIVDKSERDERLFEAAMAQKHALASEARSRLEAMLVLATTELPMPVRVEDLDAAPWILNVQNGTLDLRTRELRPHRREDLITKIAPVAYDPAARDERWEGFLRAVLPDLGVRWYVQRALGYSLCGTSEAGTLFLPFGPTHTGKTTLLEAAAAAVGSYAVTMDVSTLTSKPPVGGAPRSDIARLFGSRLVISTEVPAGARLDEALVKKLTGGDTLAYRALYQGETEAQASFVVWIGSNYKPAVRDDDDAIWERVKQIPFAQQHVGSARDDTLKPYLETTARPAVLAWLVEGAAGYIAEGLEPPAEVVTLTEEYRREMNPLTAWSEESCDLVPEAESTFGELFADYGEFTPRSDHPVGRRRFTNSLALLPGVRFSPENRRWVGIEVHRGGGGKW